MYAIIETGGKQVRVRPGDELYVEKLPGAAGDEIALSQVLLVQGEDGKRRIGTPYLLGAKVVARILSLVRGEKLLVFHKRRRKRYKKTQGHRQWLSQIRIERIEIPPHP